MHDPVPLARGSIILTVPYRFPNTINESMAGDYLLTTRNGATGEGGLERAVDRT